MHHQRSCPIRDGLDSTFCCAILVMSADAAERDILLQHFEVFDESFSVVGVIVCVVGLYAYTVRLCKAFEVVFRLQCLTSGKGDLILYPNEGGSMVVEDGASMILFGHALLSLGVR